MATMSAVGDGPSVAQVILSPDVNGSVHVADAATLFLGDYSRQGHDLVIEYNGASVLVEDYFDGAGGNLVGPNGAFLTPSVVHALAGPNAPGQYAQEGAPTAAALSEIGKVVSIEGTATITHSDGVTVNLANGDPVYQGDVVSTGAGSKLGISFIDDSVFSMSADARMVLNELIFDPAKVADSSMVVNLVQGSFVFVTGQVAPSGSMKVETPVATMGIRGTTPKVSVSTELGVTEFSILPDPGSGKVGSYVLIDKTSGAILGTVESVGDKWVITTLSDEAVKVAKSGLDLLEDEAAISDIRDAVSNALGQRTQLNGANSFQQVAFDASASSTGQDGGQSTDTGGNGQGGGNTGTDPTPDKDDPPIAGDDAFSTNEDAVLVGGNVINASGGGADVDPDGFALSVTEVNGQTLNFVGDTASVVLPANAVQQTVGANLLISKTGGITYDPSAAFNYLAVGETRIESFTYTVTDKNGFTDTATVNITVSGRNDAPEITEGPATATVTESSDIGGSGGGFTGDALSGTLAFTDVDISDTGHTYQVVSVVETRTGGAPLNPQGTAALLAMLNTTGSSDSGALGTDGTIQWNFTGSEDDFDYLALGETVTLTYTVRVTDPYGATDTQTVTINIIGAAEDGSNDTPVITVATDVSDTVAETEGALSANGSFDVRDVDITDVVSITGVTLATSGNNTDLALPSPSTLLGMFSPQSGVVIGNTATTGTVNWTFNGGTDAFDYLADGESLTLTYTVTIKDDNNASVTQEVTITITGTNDAPVISGGPDTAGLAETDAALNATGTFTVSDVDTSDAVTAAVDGLVVSGTSNRVDPAAPSDADLLAMLSVTPTAILDGTENSDTLTWSFDSDAEAFDYLADGETLILTYTVKVTDDSGVVLSNSDTETVTITITGTNDAPVITEGSSDLSGAVTENDQATALTGQVVFSDVDHGATVEATTDTGEAVLVYTPDGSSTPEPLPDGLDAAAIAAALTLNADGSWSYDASALDLEALGENDTITLTYSVTVTDEHGATDTTEISITLTGTADGDTIAEAPLVEVFGREEPIPVGAQLIANTTLDDAAQAPAVAGLSDGGYVVVWQSFDGVSPEIVAQRFDANGARVGGEIAVNTTTAGLQEIPTVTALEDGGFVVAWASDGQDGSSYGVYGQRFDAAGQPEGGEFRVNDTTSGYQGEPSLAAIEGGGFVATWVSNAGGSEEIVGQLYDANGAPVNGEFQVNVETASLQRYPAVTALEGGGFVIAWNSDGQDGSATGAFFRVYDSAGDPVTGDVQANTITDGNQRYVDVTALEGGGFVVTWQDESALEPNGDIYGQVYDASGEPVGDEFLANSTTANNQSFPTVTALDDGGFVVSWLAASAQLINAQRFDADGAPVGEEFQVNTTTVAGAPLAQPDAATLSDGSIIIVWHTNTAAGSENAVVTQRFIVDEQGATTAVAGVENANLPLDIQVQLVDTDSESISSITISGLPAGYTLSAGAENLGVWTLAEADLIGLTIIPPPGASDSFTLDIDVVSTESSNNATATTSITLDVTFHPVMVDILGTAGPDNPLEGTQSANTIFGLAGDDYLVGGEGADTYIGGGDGNPEEYDGISFSDETGGAGVYVNLATGVVTDTYGNTESATGIEEINGSQYGDTLIGNAADNYFTGGDGGDSYDGGASDFDQVSFANETGGAGAVVDLLAGTGTDTYGNEETFIAIEVLRGSQYADSFTGDGNANTFRGLAGNDFIDGGGGRDQVRYDRDANAGGGSGVTVNLTTGIAIDGFGDTDTLSNIEDVRGTQFADALIGDNGDNELFGLDGADLLIGGGGSDWMRGAEGNDRIDGGSGDDNLGGGSGADTFILAPGAGQDQIQDFNVADGDLIDLQAYGFTSTEDFADMTYNAVDNYTYIDFNGFDGLTLYGVDLTDPGEFPDPNVAFIFTGSSNLVQGTPGDDQLFGTSGNDLIVPLDTSFQGTDDIFASLGNDVFDFAGAGPNGGFYSLNYWILENSTDLTVNIGETTGTITKGDYGTDTLLHIDQIDGVNGGLGMSTVYGGTANITVDLTGIEYFDLSVSGGGSADLLEVSGTGYTNVVFYYGYEGVHVTVDSLNGTATATEIGGEGSELAVTGFVNQWRGTAGDDIFEGGDGNESFIAFGGNNTIDGGGDGLDTDTVRYDRDGVTNLSVTYSAQGAAIVTGLWAGQAFTDTLTGIEAVRGARDGTTEFVGSAGEERFDARGGISYVEGGAGNDTLNAGLNAGDGATLFSFADGSGEDTVGNFAVGRDKIDLSAYGFADETEFAITLDGSNTVIDLNGTDTITLTDIDLTNPGVDLTQVFIFDDAAIAGTSDDDMLVGTLAANTINGLAGNDTIYGFSGADTLLGGLDDDQLFGGADDDQLFGGDGSDQLTGGAGFDEFILYAGESGVDEILDFGADSNVIYLRDYAETDEVELVSTDYGSDLTVNDQVVAHLVGVDAYSSSVEILPYDGVNEQHVIAMTLV